jgi:O-antigen/teichoic acid export membrane protein
MTDVSAEKYQEITRKASRGMGWNYLSMGLGKLLNLVTLSILAHLLVPENFGIVGLATVVIEYLWVFRDLGLGAAIIQRKESVEESANTAFILNIVAGIALTALTVLLAPFAAQFFREEQVTLVMRWLSLTFVLNSFGSVHYVLLQRDLDFKKKMVPDLGNTVVKAIISIGLALAGFGVWALVIGQLVGTAVAALLVWVIVPWKPQLTWNTNIAKELFRYGASIMGVNLLGVWVDSFDYLIIGRVYAAASLAIYTLAYRLPEMLVINILWTLTAVLFPTFSSFQDERDALKKVFLSVVRYVELFVIPLCMGMFVAADPIIRVVFGEQWGESIPILRVLSLYALVVSIGFNAGDIYKAVGRPDILLKVAMPIAGIRIISLLVGAQFSLFGVAVAHLVAAIIGTSIQLMVASRILSITLLDILRQLRAFVGAGGLLALAVPALYLARGYLPLIQLIVVVAAGAIGYIGMIWLVERDSLMKLVEIVGFRRKAALPSDA